MIVRSVEVIATPSSVFFPTVVGAGLAQRVSSWELDRRDPVEPVPPPALSPSEAREHLAELQEAFPQADLSPATVVQPGAGLIPDAGTISHLTPGLEYVLLAGVLAAVCVTLATLAPLLCQVIVARRLGVDAGGIELRGFIGEAFYGDDGRLSQSRWAIVLGAGLAASVVLLACSLGCWVFLSSADGSVEGVVALGVVQVATFANAIALVLNLLPWRGSAGRGLIRALTGRGLRTRS